MQAAVNKFYMKKPNPKLTTEEREVIFKKAKERSKPVRQTTTNQQSCQKCGISVVFLESEFNYPRLCLKCALEKSQEIIPTPETKQPESLKIWQFLLFWGAIITVIACLATFILKVIDQ